MKTEYTNCSHNGRLLRGCRQEYSPVNFNEMQQIIFKKPEKTLAMIKGSKGPKGMYCGLQHCLTLQYYLAVLL